MSTVSFGRIPSEEFHLDPAEVAARLHTARGYSDEMTESCRKELLDAADARFAWTRVPVKRDNDKLDLGFGEFFSRDLQRNLIGCDEAFVFAVTLGLSVERLLLRQSMLSEAKHFITDGLASALAEAACDEAEKRIKGGLSCRPRFSPGYGDLPLEVQPGLLQMLAADKMLGITLGSSLLMTPSKSITAIMGIRNEKI